MVKIHFLNVGHGDCIIIENITTNRNTIIDINRSKSMDKSSLNEISNFYGVNSFRELISESNLSSSLESKGYDIGLTDPIDYLKNNKIKVHRLISTHPHMDHNSGLKDLYTEIGFRNVWISNHTFEHDNEKLSINQKEDWNLYQKLKSNNIENVTTIKPLEKDSRDFISQDGFSILAPNEELLKSKNPNDLSYVLLFQFANRKIVFGGDAENSTWEYIYKNYDLENIDILKASHHGRDSGYYQAVVKEMNPSYTIVSVGKKPSTDASNKYRQYSENVWSTRWKGNIVFEIEDNGEMYYTLENDR